MPGHVSCLSHEYLIQKFSSEFIFTKNVILKMVPELACFAKEIMLLHDLTFYSCLCILTGSKGSGQRNGNNVLKGFRNTVCQKIPEGSHEKSQYCPGKKQRVSVANAFNPSSSNYLYGLKQQQVNQVLEVFRNFKRLDPVDDLF